ncbi:MAG: PEP-CTERM sorting domain-containing protein [Planctomycetia bacterium]|nr:PEP-CTERM sorting domain-containing protein [Planctomycetia bacterium]
MNRHFQNGLGIFLILFQTALGNTYTGDATRTVTGTESETGFSGSGTLSVTSADGTGILNLTSVAASPYSGTITIANATVNVTSNGGGSNNSSLGNASVGIVVGKDGHLHYGYYRSAGKHTGSVSILDGGKISISNLAGCSGFSDNRGVIMLGIGNTISMTGDAEWEVSHQQGFYWRSAANQVSGQTISVTGQNSKAVISGNPDQTYATIMLSPGDGMHAQGKSTTGTFHVADVSSQLTVSAVIGDEANSSGLRKTGAGVLYMTRKNLFSGPVSVEGGAVYAQSANALGTGANGALNIDGGAVIATVSGALGNARKAITVRNGRLQVAAGGALGNTASTIDVGKDGLLEFTGYRTSNRHAGLISLTENAQMRVHGDNTLFDGSFDFSGTSLVDITSGRWCLYYRANRENQATNSRITVSGENSAILFRGNNLNLCPMEGDWAEPGITTGWFTFDVQKASSTLTITAPVTRYANKIAEVGLLKTGEGILQLPALNTTPVDTHATITGGIDVLAGTLYAAGTTNSPITIGENAVFSTGTLSDENRMAETVGELTIQDDFQLNGTWQIDFAPDSHDFLKVTGESFLADGATLILSLAEGFQPALGESFTLLETADLTVDLSQVNLSVFGELAPSTFFTLSAITEGSLTRLTATVGVPEPATWLLLVGGLIGLALRRWFTPTVQKVG